MSSIVIRDFDTAIDAYIASWVKDFSWESVKLSEEAALSIKLEGKQWDGKVDYKIAEFVIKLQKALVAAYNDQSEQKIKYNTSPMDKAGLRVTVSVEPGCSWIKVFFKDLWINMESKHKRDAVIAVALILSLTAGTVYWHQSDTEAETARISAEIALKKFQEEKKAEIERKVQERLHDESTRKDAMHAIDRAFDLAEQAVSPMAYLAGKMQKEDKMAIGEINIPASEARRLFKPATSVSVDDDMEEFHYCLDGEYVVTDIERKTENVAILFSDGKRRKFSLVWLEGPALEDFYRACAQHTVDQEIPPMSLQLDAFFKGGVFKHGAVMGIGRPREGAMSFNEAVMSAARRQEEMDAESAAE